MDFVSKSFWKDETLTSWPLKIHTLINFQGRNLCDFWLEFWKKRWPHKFILNLTDLYSPLAHTPSNDSSAKQFAISCSLNQKHSCQKASVQWTISCLVNKTFNIHWICFCLFQVGKLFFNDLNINNNVSIVDLMYS